MSLHQPCQPYSLSHRRDLVCRAERNCPGRRKPLSLRDVRSRAHNDGMTQKCTESGDFANDRPQAQSQVVLAEGMGFEPTIRLLTV